jgi:hypothetical protein
MKLKVFLEYIAGPSERYGYFQVVAGLWPFDSKSEPVFKGKIADIYADDVAKDIILLLADNSEGSQAKANSLTLRELKQSLELLSDGRLEYSVEFGLNLPEGWRYDMAFYGSATNEERQLYALCWKPD